MKIERPKKVAVCFFSTDHNKVQQQILELGLFAKDYELEIWSRAQLGKANFLSFSQLVNEAIITTESEFMIFVNPKSVISREHANEIIDGLCNGFCWVSKMSFGFFGATKELYRNIGLMDENFISGEFEDDDFGLRMKMFGKAIKWDFDLKNYLWTESPLGKRRGSTCTYFRSKWIEIEPNQYTLNKFLPPPKKLPIGLLKNRRLDIRDSWLDWSESQSDHISHVFRRANNASFRNDVEIESVRAGSKIKIDIQNNQLYVEFISPLKSDLSVQLAFAETDNEIPITDRLDVRNNTWYRMDIDQKGFNINNNTKFEIRLFHDGVNVFYNRYASQPYYQELDLGIAGYQIK